MHIFPFQNFPSLILEGVDGGANRCWLKKWNPEQVKYGGKGSIYSALGKSMTTRDKQ